METAISVKDGKEEFRLEFDATRCIHARFCVLQAPAVFKANTPGEWLFPDQMPAGRLAAVAQNCPSGAITYRAAERDLNEVVPAVNLIRLRENGPYAVTADIRLSHESGPVIRRTLCRCGASKNKPYCDGSHSAIGFEATGEPPTGALVALMSRDGPLRITPLKDGPLEIEGPVEMISGTGRTYQKLTHALLCRCGGSNNKPFCDGTHSLNGFTDAETGGVRGESTCSERGSLANAAGGRDKLRALTEAFYAKVPDDEILAPVFANMAPEHAEHVADFIAEVFGAEPLYSRGGGSHAGMIGKHLGRHITETQRQRWFDLMIETAEKVGIPHEPAFWEAFCNYLDWGSRLAVINSADGILPPSDDLPMPKWGWGAAHRSDL